MREYGFSPNRILWYTDRIVDSVLIRENTGWWTVDSVLIRENTGWWKPVFLHTLRTESRKVWTCLCFSIHIQTFLRWCSVISPYVPSPNFAANMRIRLILEAKFGGVPLIELCNILRIAILKIFPKFWRQQP